MLSEEGAVILDAHNADHHQSYSFKFIFYKDAFIYQPKLGNALGKAAFPHTLPRYSLANAADATLKLRSLS